MQQTPSIGTDAFLLCNNLKILNLPKYESTANLPAHGQITQLALGLKSVSSTDFSSFVNLVSLELPETTSISNNAFNNCTGIKSRVSLKTKSF